ncbi:hypothetical protein LEP48_17415 [Isoptericola sp. NEAU-Y5]|uniref:Uncharacterized protein n=1 Tax=Isoptericola luteus TaxID=2879484 RepID=A0ABS7ZJB5_9MICO|nr:hypothetical protein [Isoptericola sp. NEAU-Y5]MCA5895112.1 hypothetical protein [Isoptericola sp. NEAU-Y5]
MNIPSVPSTRTGAAQERRRCAPWVGADDQRHADPVLAQVERIVALDDAAYPAALTEFLAAHRPHWRRIAARLCRTSSVPASQHLDDVEAIVAETVWEMIERSRREATFLATMRSFMAIVVYTARPKVRSFLDHATAPASGMVSAQRRRRELARTRAELAAVRGSTPSVTEAVRATNERLGAARADSARQGMVVSEADELVLRGTLSFDEALDSDQLVVTAPDGALHPLDVPVLLRQVVEAARAEHPVRGRVASLWMSEAYGNGPIPGQDTVVWIARTLGLTRRAALSHVDRVREIAAERLRDMGIEAEDDRATAAHVDAPPGRAAWAAGMAHA